MNSLIKMIDNEYKVEETVYLEADEDNSEKIKLIKGELYKLKRKLTITEADLSEKREFQF